MTLAGCLVSEKPVVDWVDTGRHQTREWHGLFASNVLWRSWAPEYLRLSRRQSAPRCTPTDLSHATDLCRRPE